MNRDQLVRALRRYARKRQLAFDIDTRRGSGSHYRLRVGDEVTTVQSELNPGRIDRILKQLKVEPKDL